jgi:hypothetical protein
LARDAINNLRDELARAQQDALKAASLPRFGAPPPPRLTVDSVEVELQLELSAEVGARLQFWVVDIGSKGSRDATHRAKLTLTPHGAHGEDDEVDEQPVSEHVGGRPA